MNQTELRVVAVHQVGCNRTILAKGQLSSAIKCSRF